MKFLLVWVGMMVFAEAKLRGVSHTIVRSLEDLPLDAVANNGKPAENFPLKQCQGDCDNDDEVSWILCILLYQRVILLLVGLEVTLSQTIFVCSIVWFCVLLVGLGYPLGTSLVCCQCEEGLVCFQRTYGDSVPGCVGNLKSEMDYCVKVLDAETSSPVLNETLAPTEEDVADAVITDAPTLDGTVSTTQLGSVTTTQLDTVPPTQVDTEAVTQLGTDAATQPDTILIDESTPSTVTMDPTEEEADTVTVTVNVTAAPTIDTTNGDVLVANAATSDPTFLEDLDTLDPSMTTLIPSESEASSPNATIEGPLLNTTAQSLDLATIGNDGDFLSYPLTACQGDCDNDDDVRKSSPRVHHVVALQLVFLW